MWTFRSGWDSDGHPLLHSLNGNIGRQTWVFDPEAGTKEDVAQIEALREEFRKNRHVQKHSSDELLRYGSSHMCLFLAGNRDVCITCNVQVSEEGRTSNGSIQS